LTGRTTFTDDEWDLLREAPEAAGLIVIAAERGGTFRETFALAKAYAEARQHHGASELLDAARGCWAEKRRARSLDRRASRARSEPSPRRSRAARTEGNPDELESYRAFVVTLAQRVAAAHKENGQAVSDRERAAIEEIETSLKP